MLTIAISLTASIAAYLEENRPFWSAGTLITRTDHLRLFSGWMGERQIKPEEVKSWTADMLEAGVSPNTIIDRRATVAQLFRWAIDNGSWTAKNPVQPIRSLVRQPTKQARVTAEQYHILHDRLWPDSQSYWPLACELAWETGLRLSDVALLKWEEVSASMRGPHIRRVEQKKARYNQPIEIPISVELLERLCVRRACVASVSPRWVFPQMAAKYQSSRGHARLCHEFRYGADACGYYDITFHSFRHTFVSRLLESGAAPSVVAAMTGQSLRTMAKYSHPSLEAKREAKAMLPPTPIKPGWFGKLCIDYAKDNESSG